mgnify:CR=1 FL=1
MTDDMQHPDPKLLLDFVDEQLTRTESDAIRAHLTTCERCRNEVSLQRSIVQSLRETSLPEPSPEFDSAVLRAVGKNGSKADSRMPWTKVVAVAALISVTLIIVVVAGSTTEEQSRTILSPLFDQVTGWLQPVTAIFSKTADDLRPAMDDGNGDVLRVFLLASAALLIVGGLERFLLPRIRSLDH